MKPQGDEETSLGMPQAAQPHGKPLLVGNIMVFLLSLTLHTAALAALWFLAVPALGSGEGGGAGGYVTVSLLAGLPGNSGGSGSGAVSANAADTAATPESKSNEPPADTPVSDAAPAVDHAKQTEPAPAEPSVPVPDAAVPVRVAKPAPKARPATPQPASQ